MQEILPPKLERIKFVCNVVMMIVILLWLASLVAFAFEKIFMPHIAVTTGIYLLVQTVISRISVWVCYQAEKETKDGAKS